MAVKHDNSKTTESKSHDGTSTKGRVEAIRPSSLLSRDSGTHVGIHSHLHSQVPTCHGSNGTEEEGNGSEDTARNVPSSTPHDEDQNDDGKANDKPEANSILGSEKTLCTLVNGFVDLDKTPT